MATEEDDKFAARIAGLLEYHRVMLSDEPRNVLLAEAIRQTVTSDTAFLDIGAGSGAWAIYAATLGAKRVVAVEIEEALIPIIYKHAAENGVADRIEIIHGDCKDVEIDGRFDVIVSELFGHNALGAETVASFVDIRERFLADGGILIPEKLSLVAVPVRIEHPSLPAGLPIKSDFLGELRLNYPRTNTLSQRDNVTFLASPEQLVVLDFASVKEALALSKLTASWELEQVGQANAIATFNLSRFRDGLELNSLESQSWSLALYEFAPFDVGSGTLSFTINMEPENVNWSVSLPSHQEIRPRAYAPVFGFTRLRMAQQSTPHLSFPSKKDPV